MSPKIEVFTAADLELREFSPIRSYIDGFVLEGLGILGGRPKLGKSWWCLRAALTIATGGVAFGNPGRGVERARVLYLALEDGPRRLQRRLAALIVPGNRWPPGLTFATAWPRLDKGGLDELADMTGQGFEVVFIDTLGRVREPRPGRDVYGEDLAALAGLHGLTQESPGLAIWLVHHNRKDDRPDDYVDALSGSTGLTGVVDHIAVLTRGRGEADATVRFTSRDADEHDTSFRLDGGGWTELGDAALYELTKARRIVLEAMRTLKEATGADIADYVGKDRGQTFRVLTALADDGFVTQVSAGGPWRAVNQVNRVNGDEEEPD